MFPMPPADGSLERLGTALLVAVALVVAALPLFG